MTEPCAGAVMYALPQLAAEAAFNQLNSDSARSAGAYLDRTRLTAGGSAAPQASAAAAG